MTITVKTLDDGSVFTAETPEQLVGLLWKDAFIRESTPDQYMSAVARRVKLWNGHDVRDDDATLFLLDLESAGLIDVGWEA